MKTLETIQKAFRVFQTIAKIIHILCIVGAVMCGVGALCAITQYLGGQVFGITGEPLTLFSDATALPQMYVRLCRKCMCGCWPRHLCLLRKRFFSEFRAAI